MDRCCRSVWNLYENLKIGEKLNEGFCYDKQAVKIKQYKTTAAAEKKAKEKKHDANPIKRIVITIVSNGRHRRSRMASTRTYALAIHEHTTHENMCICKEQRHNTNKTTTNLLQIHSERMTMRWNNGECRGQERDAKSGKSERG